MLSSDDSNDDINDTRWWFLMLSDPAVITTGTALLLSDATSERGALKCRNKKNYMHRFYIK